MRQGYRPPDVFSAQLKRETMFYGGIWVVFLAWPVVSVATSGASLPAKMVGELAILAFVVVYLHGLTHPRVFFGAPRWVTTLGYTAILALFVVATGLVAGSAALTMASYLLALWLFSHPWRTGLAGASAVTAVVATIGLVTVSRETLFYLLIPLGSTLAILLLVRFMVERDETDRAVEQQLALGRQREDLARTVHDVLGHSLTAITVSAQLARRLVERDPQAAAAQLDNILSTARTALSEVRSTVVELRQPDLWEQLQVTKTLLDAAGIAPDLPKPRTLDALEEGESDLFAWCLREGITNVVRHSRATRCAVRIGVDHLRIDDDGVGLHESGGAPGNGLTGLRQRVEEAGGMLTIGDLPESERADARRPGTRLEVVL